MHHRIQPPVHVGSLAVAASIVCHYGSKIRKAFLQWPSGDVVRLLGCFEGALLPSNSARSNVNEKRPRTVCRQSTLITPYYSI